MKAIVYTYGPGGALQLREVARPMPQDDEVLIKIHAAPVTIEDPAMRSTNLGRRKEAILGIILAGEIEAAGRRVTRFKEGDQVYGFTGWRRLGAYAEYTCMPEKGALALMPANLTYEEAAAIPDGGLTALPFLRDRGKIQSGQKVLVYGASGAVGTAAIQIARSYGAQVTGVCSAANLDLVKSLGAEEVIDYTGENFTRNGQTYDIIFDAVGKIPFSGCENSLAPRGIFLSTVPMPDTVVHMLRTLLVGGKKVRFAATGLRPARKKAKDLAIIKDLVEAGKITAVIDRRYPLEQAAEAFRYVETGRKKGNVVLTVDHSDKS